MTNPTTTAAAPVPRKPMAKSKTVLAAAATVIAYLAAKHLGAPPDIAEAIGVIGMGMVAMFMRAGVEDSKA